MDLGVLYLKQKKYPLAREHLNKAAGIFRETEADGYLKETQAALAKLGDKGGQAPC